VDDDPDVRMFAAECLADLDYAVVEAASGAAAINELDSGQAIDLVLTDLAMPGMTGADLAHWLMSNRPALPILVMTGFADLQGFELPADLPVLNKPFRRGELATRIDAALNRASGADVLAAGRG
jgi:CheY-like chemotaxis protein